MFKDLAKKIERFYEMGESESDSFRMELNTRINRNPEAFKHFMSSIGYGFGSNRAMFYESLIISNATKWEHYIFSELKLLITKTEQGDEDARSRISSVYWLTDIPNMSNGFYTNTKAYLISKLDSNIPEVRKYVLTAIFEMLFHLNQSPNSEEIIMFQRCLKDKNFNTKVFAYANLKESNLIPEGFRFSIIEKIRIKWEGYSQLVQ